MVADFRKTVKAVNRNFEASITKRWLVSNPAVPRAYFLAKIHKPENKVRPIVANVNAPTEKLSKWLVASFKSIQDAEISIYLTQMMAQ